MRKSRFSHLKLDITGRQTGILLRELTESENYHYNYALNANDAWHLQRSKDIHAIREKIKLAREIRRNDGSGEPMDILAEKEMRAVMDAVDRISTQDPILNCLRTRP